LRPLLVCRARSGHRIVRPIQECDFANWKPLGDAYNSLRTPRRHGFAEGDDSFDVAAILRRLRSDARAGLRAGGPTGRLVHFLFHRSTISSGPVRDLQDLFTLEWFRGKGGGRALIEAVYARAAAAGCSRVCWHTRSSNETAMQVYDKVTERSGFVVDRKMLESALGAWPLAIDPRLYPGGQCMARPPRTCRWRWSTVCPPSSPLLITTR